MDASPWAGPPPPRSASPKMAVSPASTSRSSRTANTGPRGVGFEGEEEKTSSTTVTTSLEGALNQTIVLEKAGAKASAPMQALIRAGQVLSENKPLVELFPVILDLAIQAVNAQRGVLLILGGQELVPRAHKGDGF